ncbi:hypothetical protein PROFUN_04593 [Planoprotostelium fungivorum]|uniref:NadR/Ttd14 AAA domain-containing protein n=1 Tax=Planoprotostelium fungivorum TaxID=1890364 RepID=A0A2P6NUF0_9EUKA|nr:hypothetical protein PROFUN_04593 [Planoprotostelium fungivorum]
MLFSRDIESRFYVQSSQSSKASVPIFIEKSLIQRVLIQLDVAYLECFEISRVSRQKLTTRTVQIHQLPHKEKRKDLCQDTQLQQLPVHSSSHINTNKRPNTFSRSFSTHKVEGSSESDREPLRATLQKRLNTIHQHRDPSKPMLIVLCVEGCHGTGKTSVCSSFRKAGFNVLDEGFLDMPNYGLSPQTLVMESIWVTNWFQRILSIRQQLGERDGLVIVDRSPYSAVYYAGQKGKILEPWIREQIEDLKKDSNVFTYTVSLKVEQELLWTRISERLKRQPERAAYREDSRDWMDATNNWYNSRDWDFIIENNEKSIQDLMDALVTCVSGRDKTFMELCKGSATQSVEGCSWTGPVSPMKAAQSPVVKLLTKLGERNIERLILEVLIDPIEWNAFYRNL